MFYGKGVNDMPTGWYSESELNKKIYHCWHHMLYRCYNKNVENTTYKNCSVCDRWLKLSNFVADISLIDGYNLWLTEENIALDKDIKSDGENKVYCLEQCMFVTIGDNTRQAVKSQVGKPKTEEQKAKISNTLKGQNVGVNHPRSRAVIGVNIKDGSTVHYKYAKEANKDGFNSKHIGSCCKGNKKTHKGYVWYYADEYKK